MSGFRVALPNPDAVDSWMVKNRLYPNLKRKRSLFQQKKKKTEPLTKNVGLTILYDIIKNTNY